MRSSETWFLFGGMGGGFAELPVDVLSVAYPDDKDDQVEIEDLVGDPVGAVSDAAESCEFPFQGSPAGR